MPYLQRTRLMPGPLLLMVLGWLTLAGIVVHAHDTGLSSLDVNVTDNLLSATLSIAASDVSLIAPSDDVRQKVSELARDAVCFFIDGRVVPPIVHGVSLEDGAARIEMSFAFSRGDRGLVTIASDVPKRLASGHRELLTVTVDGRGVLETLLDSRSGPATFELGSASRSAARSAGRFLELGFRHILAGYDHLVFLAGLLLAARAVRELVMALTTFTAAHSVSLALVVVGGIHASPSIVEPLIAASIAWVGFDNLLGHRRGVRWVVIFGFGLIHGFGFAGALLELGFGSSIAEMSLALISFNLGVETGQLAVAAAMLPFVWIIKSRPAWQARLVPLCSLTIVLAGGYWLIERLP